MSGYVAWSGKSRLDSKPIVVIVTGVGTTKSEQTRNEKTGPLVQVWYLRSDISPLQAISSGEDRSICGNCKLRGHIEETEDGPRNRMRSCYVEVQNAPRSIYQSYRDGKYEPLTDDIRWPTQATRLGSYGDPNSASFAVNKDLISRGNGKQTGYTHQANDRRFAPMRKMVMASVHSEDEARELQSQGWRTFRTMSEGDELMPNELMCPASEAEGKRLTCEECMACSGIGLNKSRQGAASVAIYAHGSPSKMGSYRKTFEV